MALTAAAILKERYGITEQPSPSVLTDVLTRAARTVVFSMDDAVLYRQATAETDSGSGVDITDKRVVKAIDANGYEPIERPLNEATLYNAGKGGVVAHGASMWYVSANTAYIKLYGGTTGGTFYTVSVPSVSSSDTSVSGWPADFIDLVCCQAAIELKERALRRARGKLPTDITLPTAPTAPSAPAITYSNATAGTVSATSIGALPTPPTYSSSSAGAKPTAPTVPALTLSASAPTAPTLTVVGLTLPSAPSAPTLDGADLSLVGLTIPTAPTLTAVDLDLSALTFPSAPSFPSLSLSYSEYSAYYAEEDTEMMEGVLRKLDREVAEYTAGIQFEAEKYIAQIRGYREQWEALVADEQIDLQADRVEIEKYAAEVRAYEAELAALVADEEMDLAEDRTKLEKYAAEIQQYRVQIEGLRAVEEIDLAEDRAAIEKYAAQVQAYIAEVQAEVQDYRSEWETKVAAYRAEGDIEGLFLRLGIEQAVNTLRPELEDYIKEADRVIEQARVTLQEAITDANNATEIAARNAAETTAAAVQDYVQELALFRAQVELYLAEVSAHERIFMAHLERFKTLILTLQREKKELVMRFREIYAAYRQGHGRAQATTVTLYSV